MIGFDNCLNEVMKLDGVLCCSVVDSNSGMMMDQRGTGVDLEIASAGNTEVVRAKLKTIEMLNLNDVIEDMLITLGKQYHIIRPIKAMQGVFIYAVIDRKANLAMARRQIQDAESLLQA